MGILLRECLESMSVGRDIEGAFMHSIETYSCLGLIDRISSSVFRRDGGRRLKLPNQRTLKTDGPD
jgi:hypothetical protein